MANNRDVSLSWMPCVLSTITTGTIKIVNVDFDMFDDDSAWCLDLLIDTVEQSGYFERIDTILSRGNFANLDKALVSVAVMTRIALVRTQGYAVTGERWTRWEQLVREKMPRAEKRGILRYIR